jgi:hypothetical protein
MGLSVTLGRWLGMVVMLVTLGPTLPPVCSLASLLARLSACARSLASNSFRCLRSALYQLGCLSSISLISFFACDQVLTIQKTLCSPEGTRPAALSGPLRTTATDLLF